MSDCAEHPLVSVVIPCWNGQKYIGDAIESALAQTYSNKEVIVIDDGSTDGSLDIVKLFGNDVRWGTGPNQGACTARNRGLELAKGELIQFLDADDLLHPEKLTLMVPVALEKRQNHVVVCDWEHIDVGKIRPVRRSLRFPEYIEDYVIWCSTYPLATPSPLHWKSVLKEVGGFDEALHCAQERELHLRLACHGLAFTHLPEVLVSARRQIDSLSSDSLRVLRQHLYIVNKAHRLLEQLNRVNDQRSAGLAGLLARDARIFLREGFTEEAEEYFQAARALHPGGGLEHAYKPLHKAAARLVGPVLFERMVALKRSLRPRRARANRIASTG